MAWRDPAAVVRELVDPVPVRTNAPEPGDDTLPSRFELRGVDGAAVSTRAKGRWGAASGPASGATGRVARPGPGSGAVRIAFRVLLERLPASLAAEVVGLSFERGRGGGALGRYAHSADGIANVGHLFLRVEGSVRGGRSAPALLLSHAARARISLRCPGEAPGSGGHSPESRRGIGTATYSWWVPSPARATAAQSGSGSSRSASTHTSATEAR